MPFQFRPCTVEMDYKAYIHFLLQHHAGLNLPYPFAMKLSFISSPLLFGKGMLIIDEEPYEIAAAAGFVYGTGANEYKDRHICQVEVAFIRSEYRRTFLFIRGLQALVDEMKAGNPDVEQVQFWTSAEQGESEKLFSKFGALPGSTKTLVNDLAFYTVPFRELEALCRRFIPSRNLDRRA
ncbi:hypothetical protein FE783_09710 [Paenibacillus mesophilus]|uniref:hypothetical protein n=1 Tax=Paenibacillus mesophilus TaxID=2582849 RepID=UPI00110F38A3|nr:hypothetical protein [Paenibacillus mesophilus]TMV50926.1 hypothetical protein FE783_09710 [Paenibacillus mesophilus]